MKLHFKDTEVALAPMMWPEIEYWLGRGYKIFQHQDLYWMCVKHHKGHRVLIEVPIWQLERVLKKRAFERVGIISRMKQ
jgi:hypothetical protein